MLVLLVLGVFVQRIGGTDTGHHVFTLGVDEPFAIELVVAGGGVTGEGHAGGGGVTHIAEHHGLHIDGSTPVVRDAFDAAVGDSLLAVPALEHGLDATFELGLGVIGELGVQHLLDAGLERLGEFLEVVGSQFGVALIAFLLFVSVQHVIQLLADALSVGRLDALGLLHDDVGVHHDKTAVGVIHKTFVATGLLDQARDGLGAKTDIQNGVHHARH